MNKYYIAAIGIGSVALLFGRKAIAMTTSNAPFNDSVSIMAKAIIEWESGGNKNALNYRQNNPGNLKNASQSGVTGEDSRGHAIFDTWQHGYDALIRQLNIAFTNKSVNYNSSMSLYEFFNVYAEANSNKYAEFVAQQLNVSPDTKLEDL